MVTGLLIEVIAAVTIVRQVIIIRLVAIMSQCFRVSVGIFGNFMRVL